MNTNHKYSIGELVMWKRPRSDCTLPGAAAPVGSFRKNVFGVITWYEDRYYIVSWCHTVPLHYTGVLSEDEIIKLRSNIETEVEFQYWSNEKK